MSRTILASRYMLVLAMTLAGAAGSSAAEPTTLNQPTADETAAGFRPLFNGKDFSAWKPNGKPGSFSVKDGMIVGDRPKGSDLAYWLSTEREYGDFELRLQYRISRNGNSGIFLRAPHEGRTSKMGMEIQILDDAGKPGAPGVGDTGAIYRVVAPKRRASKPAGEWNDLWILCDGDRVRVTLNGEVVTDASMADHADLKTRPRTGYIGLSAHTDPVHFRNIRLREIRRTPPQASAPTTSPTTP